jgi:DNA gyrase/topoisomerase IV subunit B
VRQRALEYLDCEVWRDGKIHSIGFERGKLSPLHEVGADPRERRRSVARHGDVPPRPQIFPDTTFNYETLATACASSRSSTRA